MQLPRRGAPIGQIHQNSSPGSGKRRARPGVGFGGLLGVVAEVPATVAESLVSAVIDSTHSALNTLLLTAAEYEPDVAVRLFFDRAIDIDALQPAQIIVDDGYAELTRYAGTGAGQLVQENVVEILIEAIGPSQGTGMTLTASNATGIVAIDDGGTWAGVTDLGLPFP